MADYIERAKVAEFFEKNNQVMWHKDDIAATVSSKSIPAADVVKVVRCRECNSTVPVGYGFLFCKRIQMVINNDGFCGQGERRTHD